MACTEDTIRRSFEAVGIRLNMSVILKPRTYQAWDQERTEVPTALAGVSDEVTVVALSGGNCASYPTARINQENDWVSHGAFLPI